MARAEEEDSKWEKINRARWYHKVHWRPLAFLWLRTLSGWQCLPLLCMRNLDTAGTVSLLSHSQYSSSYVKVPVWKAMPWWGGEKFGPVMGYRDAGCKCQELCSICSVKGSPCSHLSSEAFGCTHDNSGGSKWPATPKEFDSVCSLGQLLSQTTH
jgi:hypothetical protein